MNEIRTWKLYGILIKMDSAIRAQITVGRCNLEWKIQLDKSIIIYLSIQRGIC